MSPPDGTSYGGRRPNLAETLAEAIRDFEIHGFDSQDRLDRWMQRIRQVADATMVPPERLAEMLNRTLGTIYTRAVDRGGLLRIHRGGPSRMTVDRVRPHLRAELDRTIMASANLIKLNRKAAVNKTVQRFAGWASSVPAGGSQTVESRDVKTDVRKSLMQLPFEDRRVAIDQGHKLSAGLSRILAADGGAIAARWHSHFRQAGYNARPDHKARDGNVYLIRGSWALDKGLIKPGPAGYTDEITQPAEEVFCRCAYQFLYALRDLPDELLTERGRSELARVRAA